MPQIEILMATRNGARHLPAQLASFAAQEFHDWSLRVSDDGSTDATRAILQDFRLPAGGVPKIADGPGRGAAANFLSLLTAPDLPTDRHVALSDQDDVWFPDKLGRAMAALSEVPPEKPALYCSRTILTDPDLHPLGPARRHRRLVFGNALVQNVVAGNTTVLNPAALELVRRAGPVAVAHHDWWLYALMSATGARLIYDREPTLFYRQHGGNELGENVSLAARRRRAGLVADGTWRRWLNANLAALRQLSELTLPQWRAALGQAGDLPGNQDSGQRAARARWLGRLRPFRQSAPETLALYAAILSGRVG